MGGSARIDNSDKNQENFVYDLSFTGLVRCLQVLHPKLDLLSVIARANMGHIWGRQDPGGAHVGPMNFAIWDVLPYAVYFKAPHNGFKEMSA